MLRYGSLSDQDRNTILFTFARMTQEFTQPELLRLSEDIVVRFDSDRPRGEYLSSTDRSESTETDPTAAGTEPIIPSENNRSTGLPRSRLLGIAGAVVLLVIALALAFRGNRRQNRHH